MYTRELSTGKRYFNSQPHKEADDQKGKIYERLYISTHSLTRRLTVFNALTNNGEVISTHSLTRRLTKLGIEVKAKIIISTHSLTRRLTTLPITAADCLHISTHSLTRRLTGLPSNTSQMTIHFNSQPHKEADVGVEFNHNIIGRFQLTASQGG